MSCLREDIKVDHNEADTWKQWVTIREETLVRGEEKNCCNNCQGRDKGHIGRPDRRNRALIKWLDINNTPSIFGTN